MHLAPMHTLPNRHLYRPATDLLQVSSRGHSAVLCAPKMQQRMPMKKGSNADQTMCLCCRVLGLHDSGFVQQSWNSWIRRGLDLCFSVLIYNFRFYLTFQPSAATPEALGKATATVKGFDSWQQPILYVMKRLLRKALYVPMWATPPAAAPGEMQLNAPWVLQHLGTVIADYEQYLLQQGPRMQKWPDFKWYPSFPVAECFGHAAVLGQYALDHGE